jgi:HAMP domain-containing protein
MRRSLFLEVVGAAALVAVLTGSIVGIANLRAGRAVLDQHLREGLKRDTELIRAALSERIASACTMVGATAKDPDLRGTDIHAVQIELDRRIEDATLLANLYYYAPDGTLSAVAYHDGRDIQKYLGRPLMDPAPGKSKKAATDAIEKAVKSGKAAFSRAFLDSDQLPMFVYAVPVQRPDGQAVLSSGIKGSDPRLGHLLDVLRPAHGGFVAFVDPDLGVVVRAGDPPDDLDLGKLKKDGVTALGGFMVAKADEERTGLVVVIGVPASSSRFSLEALSQDVLLSTLIAILIAALLAAGFARRLGVPLQAIVAALRSVQQGAYAHRIEVEATGELGEAVEAFNEMAGKLQRSRVIERVWSDTWDE